MRFYEVGVQRCEEIRMQMMLFLDRIIEEGVPIDVPARCNCAVEGTEEVMAHYIESEIREVSGETRGCLGWPLTE